MQIGFEDVADRFLNRLGMRKRTVTEKMVLMCLRGNRGRPRALDMLAELPKTLRTVGIKIGLADKHLESTRKDGEEGRQEPAGSEESHRGSQ